jgi:hypothetical protein
MVSPDDPVCTVHDALAIPEKLRAKDDRLSIPREAEKERTLPDLFIAVLLLEGVSTAFIYLSGTVS